MNTTKFILIALFFFSFSINLSAGEFEELKEFYVPLPEMKHPADNPWSKEKEDLGAMLYFAPRLSGFFYNFYS